MTLKHSNTPESTIQPGDLVNKKYCPKSEIDPQKLAAALAAALRILRNDPTITVTVTRPSGGAQ